MSTVEAANLWDHLTCRYDNYLENEIFFKFANDIDFKLTLTSGLNILEDQIKLLEKELNYFAIFLPNRPGKMTLTPRDTEIFSDDHMYRCLLTGIQEAAILHAQTVKECTYNDRIRDLFKKLLLDEMDIVDGFYKMGKMKGWFHPIPTYGG
ncbi:MAG: DUF3231 family protein [Eubacteriales bacterium]